MRTHALRAAAALLWSAVLVLVCVWLYPLQVHDTAIAFRLWRAGVKVERIAGMKTFVRDACLPGRPCPCTALVHGLGDSARTWDKLLTAGKEIAGHKLYAFNMPGTEGSNQPVGASGYGIREQAAALRRALASRCDQWTLAGNSLGGWISAWVAIDWPQGVGHLVLIDSAGLRDLSGRSRESAEALADPTAENIEPFLARAYHMPRKIPKRILRLIADRIRSRPTRKILEAIEDEDFLDGELGRVKVKTSVFWGASDYVLPSDQAMRFKEGIPGATLNITSLCGHLPQKECPAALMTTLFGGPMFDAVVEDDIGF